MIHHLWTINPFLPVYLSEIEYRGAFGTIERDVLSSFTNKLTGITEKGGNEAVINAKKSLNKYSKFKI